MQDFISTFMPNKKTDEQHNNFAYLIVSVYIAVSATCLISACWKRFNSCYRNDAAAQERINRAKTRSFWPTSAFSSSASVPLHTDTSGPTAAATPTPGL